MAEDKKRTFECADIPKISFEHFVNLKNRNQLCDVTLQIGGVSVFAHRVILAAVIPYFRGIFNSEVDQKDDSMPDVDPDALKCLIEFAYTCKVKIDKENVRNLLAAACYLGVDAVRDACCDFLVDIFEPEDILNIREFAYSLNCAELLKHADHYVQRNFEQISQTKSFLQCPSTYIKELIGKDDIHVDKEEKILEAVINWVKSSPKERSNELPELMGKIRMTLMEPLYLTRILEREEIIRASLLCRDLIEEARNYVLFPEFKRCPCRFVTEPRESFKKSKTNESNGRYLCTLEGQMKFTAQHFDLVEEKWHTKESHIVFLNAGSSAELQKKMYFFSSSITKEYDPAKNLYRLLDPMPTPRLFTTATALKHLIYICGGKIGQLPSNDVECFDPEKNEWRILRLMKISCWGSSSVRFGEYVFVFGGRDCKHAYDTVQRYDSVKEKWKIMSPLLAKRYCGSAATLNDKIYICGGYVYTGGTSANISASAEVYDPIQNRSTFISSMTTVRGSLTLLSCRGKLCALGGTDRERKSLKSVDVYDPDRHLWTLEEDSDMKLSVSSAVVI